VAVTSLSAMSPRRRALTIAFRACCGTVTASICLAVLGSIGYPVWRLTHDEWRDHTEARSPDGQHLAVSRNRYSWAPIYGWNHYWLSLQPPARFRCTTPDKRWRGTPHDIAEWKVEHQYATFNGFDSADRFPKAIRWLNDREFVVEGGEGSGAVFELER